MEQRKVIGRMPFQCVVDLTQETVVVRVVSPEVAVKVPLKSAEDAYALYETSLYIIESLAGHLPPGREPVDTPDEPALINECGLPPRAATALMSHGLSYLHELQYFTPRQLAQIRGVSESSAKKIVEVLSEAGHNLKEE